jgi:hypothetical protein
MNKYIATKFSTTNSSTGSWCDFIVWGAIKTSEKIGSTGKITEETI